MSTCLPRRSLLRSDGVVSATQISPELRLAAEAAVGFMPTAEGEALYAAALAASAACPSWPWLELGTYCGKSAVWLGAAAQAAGAVLFTVDHHRGSEENQAGWEHHDTSLVDPDIGRMDTLPRFRRTIFDAGLEDVVIAVVGRSTTVSRHWSTPLAFCLIDGGHGAAQARADYEGWAHHVASGGILAIHDVFTDAARGGQTPYEQIYLPAIRDGFVEQSEVGSLRILKR
jgi:predicted O-methyltransferase YrrM